MPPRWVPTPWPASIAHVGATNLAREVLELHTLGVRSGYTQDDVLHFANVLTGWTFLPTGDNPEHGGEYTFNRRLHEPGPQTIMDAGCSRPGPRHVVGFPAALSSIAVVTEFGRTARINGTDGTDHGTGTVALSPAARSGEDG
jgi:Protein of unknown function (DUF1800)/Protein of unknown function (DUF1501)